MKRIIFTFKSTTSALQTPNEMLSVHPPAGPTNECARAAEIHTASGTCVCRAILSARFLPLRQSSTGVEQTLRMTQSHLPVAVPTRPFHRGFWLHSVPPNKGEITSCVRVLPTVPLLLCGTGFAFRPQTSTVHSPVHIQSRLSQASPVYLPAGNPGTTVLP